MTVPTERSRALVCTYGFLKDLLNPAITPRVPKDVRAHAKWLLRHYPEPTTVATAHNLCPRLFGPLPEHMPSRAETPPTEPGANK